MLHFLENIGRFLLATGLLMLALPVLGMLFALDFITNLCEHFATDCINGACALMKIPGIPPMEK